VNRFAARGKEPLLNKTTDSLGSIQSPSQWVTGALS